MGAHQVLGSDDKGTYFFFEVIEVFQLSSFYCIKRTRISEFLNIEMCLLEWIKQTLDKNIPINGPLLKDKSKEFATKLGIQNFSAGNGWRHDIALKKKQLGKVNL